MTGRRPVDGVLLLDKPVGLSSNAALQSVKRLYQARKARKAGHTGSLDPLASGMLPICLGEATKFFNAYPPRLSVPDLAGQQIDWIEC